MAAKSPKNRGLGRGLDALFADQTSVSEQEPKAAAASTNDNSVVYLDINEIKPNQNQPRKKFDEEKIAELADSIIAHGIIQPLVVRRNGKGFEIVAGERRWRAARKAELKAVPWRSWGASPSRAHGCVIRAGSWRLRAWTAAVLTKCGRSSCFCRTKAKCAGKKSNFAEVQTGLTC